MSASVPVNESKTSWLDRAVLSTFQLDVEKTLYLLFFVLAILTRFWALGDRGMSHDESLHTYYSWSLYKGGGFSHTPLMHGPFLFHINALFYSLFGADDFTARISVAIFGVTLVVLPYFMRRWLGRTGGLLASFMLLISPSIWYHGRYIRDEAYMLVWGTLIVWAIFAYVHKRGDKWLYLIAVALAFGFLSMESTFILAVIFGVFVSVAALIELSQYKDFWGGILGRSVLGLAVAALIAIGIVVLQTLIMGAVGLGSGDPMPFPQPPLPLQEGVPIEFSAQLTYWLQMAGGAAKVLLFSLVPAIAIAVAIYYWFKFILPDRLRESPSFDLAAVILTLSLYMLSAGALVAFNPAWKLFTGTDFVNVAFFTDGNFPINDIGPVMRLAALFGAFAAVSVAIGWWWKRRVWLIASAIFFGSTIPFFTTFFTNAVGLGTGFVGSLGYWLEQQGVQRGSQPIYYYFVVTPVYEYLPMLISSVAAIFYIVRGLRNWRRGGKLTSDWDLRLVVPLLIWWCLGSWVAFSYAGEKMPWLTVYLALPMIMLSGKFLGEWFERIPWRSFITERWWLAGLLLAAAIVSGAWLFGNLQRAFGSQQLDGLTTFAAWFAALVVLAFVLWGLWRMTPRPTWQTLLRLAALLGLLVLTVLTIRTGWIWNFITYDSALEFGVYAHGGPGLKVAMKQIEELSQRTSGGLSIRVGFDAESSWPYYWYLRDYPNKFQYADSPSRGDLDAPIIITSDKTWHIVDSALQRTHTYWQGHRIWWPMEEYKFLADCPSGEVDPATGATVNVAAYDENGDGTIDEMEKRNGQARCTGYSLRQLPQNLGTLARWFIEPDRRNALLDIFLNRDYAQYVRVRNADGEQLGPHTPDNWPLVNDFRIYVRNDLASKIWTEALGTTQPIEQPTGDPYAEGWRDVAAVQVFGSGIGPGEGQFQSPQGIVVAQDGSIYVADSLNHRVQKFDPKGQFVAAIGGPVKSSQPGLFNEPWDVAVAPDGSIYVADTWNHRVQRFNADGAYMNGWGAEGNTDGQVTGSPSVFFGPRGIATDKDGRVLVSDTGNKRVQIFAGDGTFISQFGGSGLQPGQLDEPVGIDTDAQGNIAVADTWNGRVQIFNGEGGSSASWEIDGWLDKDKVGKPYVAMDQQGHVYVADQTGLRILVFDRAGQYLGSFGQYGNGSDDRGFGLPSGVAVDQEGFIYVVDTVFGRVLKYPPFEPTVPAQADPVP
ncbi:Serine/threonine-protein kinase PknD [Thermoflexales bacterium]|nr:Serine/threonine-protein kinase PknD [Thermoflexales bacterium]